MIKLGYPAKSRTLSGQGIILGKTTRFDTIMKKESEKSGSGIAYLQELFLSNLAALYKTLEYNSAHKIFLYRIPSDLAPHITNPSLLPKSKRSDYTALAYSMKPIIPVLKKIGDYAKKHYMRLTFHPDPFVVLNSLNPEIIIRSKRTLYWHTLMLEYMGLDLNSILVLHGGGTYGNKQEATQRWITTFNELPLLIKKRIVIENDEYSYNIDDVLKISNSVKPYPITMRGKKYMSKLPIVFDIFHYNCYNKAIEKNPKQYGTQLELDGFIPDVINSWGLRTPKFHVSEQDPGSVMGAHSDYISAIPEILLEIPAKYKVNIDIMIEARHKELAVFKLRDENKNLH